MSHFIFWPWWQWWCAKDENRSNIGVRQGVATDSLNFHLVSPCPTLLRLAGGPTLKQHYSLFRGSPRTGQAACGRLLLAWTPHAVSLCAQKKVLVGFRNTSLDLGRTRKAEEREKESQELDLSISLVFVMCKLWFVKRNCSNQNWWGKLKALLDRSGERTLLDLVV
jgi:hypothetical protein